MGFRNNGVGFQNDGTGFSQNDWDGVSKYQRDLTNEILASLKIGLTQLGYRQAI